MADNQKQGGALAIVRITLSLLVICAIVSAVVTAVHGLTYETYQLRLLEQKQAAISALFDGAAVSCEALPTEGDEVKELYRVCVGETVVGYCANVSSAGFGGDIDMMVAVSPDGVLRGVQIVSMSETPGLGSRVSRAEYLAGYAGMTLFGSHAQEDLVLGEDIDAISGATISSRAVLSGVNAALRVLRQYVTVEVE
ncbi:MAG: RnfABCDGE type electron transport complex subunit G [Clostridia bacterium]|nr:RnfABCDGE type electron transport complex subunit G [Clostridia bacterium]